MYSREVLESNFCNNNDAGILVSDDITIIDQNIKTEVAFKIMQHSY